MSTRPSRPNDAYISSHNSLVQKKACRLFGVRPQAKNQYWLVLNWTHRNKFYWKLNQDAMIFIQENEFENAACKTATIRCVNTLGLKLRGWHFAGPVSKHIFLKEYFRNLIRNLFLGGQFIKSQHWFRQWLDTSQTPSHKLEEWWHSLNDVQTQSWHFDTVDTCFFSVE